MWGSTSQNEIIDLMKAATMPCFVTWISPWASIQSMGFWDVGELMNHGPVVSVMYDDLSWTTVVLKAAQMRPYASSLAPQAKKNYPIVQFLTIARNKNSPWPHDAYIGPVATRTLSSCSHQAIYVAHCGRGNHNCQEEIITLSSCIILQPYQYSKEDMV